MGIAKSVFGKTKDGKDVLKFEISNTKGMKAGVISFGAILTELYVPDDKGEVKDIVLGYDNVEAYFDNGSFFGATVGPNANRISNAEFTIDGVKYKIDANDGPNNLHSHFDLGYHKRLWSAEAVDNSVKFYLEDEDGNMGFPGNKKVTVTYTLTEDNELKIAYNVISDKNTVVNMTNHSYFNLKGHDGGRIEDHMLMIDASTSTVIAEGDIPTGEIVNVKGSEFDFTKPMLVGEHIDDDIEQLTMVKGYDHNWIIDSEYGSIRKIAEVTCEGSGRKMEVYSDLPAVQFYAGNCIAPTTGKGGVSYGPRSGMCLETQTTPDSIHFPEWPSTIYGPDREYKTTTIYKFS